MFEVVEYLDENGHSPFNHWFQALDLRTGARLARVLVRMSQGNLADVRSAGGGIQESRVDFGPGYRIYFGRDGDRLVILLAGGTKRRQQADIEKARTRWMDYKRRKRKSE